MTKIHSGSFFTEAWNTFYYALSGNVTTPQPIYSSFPNIGRSTFVNYPAIELKSPELDLSNLGMGSSAIMSGPVRFEINVYHTADSQIDATMGQIWRTIKAARNWGAPSGLEQAGLHISKHEFSGEDIVTLPGGKLCNTKSLLLTVNYDDR